MAKINATALQVHKLVPTKPTGEMLAAFHGAIRVWLNEEGNDEDVYKAMLDAAPELIPNLTKEWLAKAIEQCNDGNSPAAPHPDRDHFHQEALQNATEAVINAWDRETHGPMNGHLWNDMKSLVSIGIKTYLTQFHPAHAHSDIELTAAKAQIAELQKQLNEADRRAGAAERQMEDLKEAAAKRSNWLYKAKQEAGYDSSISFDIVWAETLALAKLAMMEMKQRNGIKD